MSPRTIYTLIILTLAAAIVAAFLISNFSPPRQAAARAGGNLTSVNPASEAAVRHPLKDQGRVPQ